MDEHHPFQDSPPVKTGGMIRDIFTITINVTFFCFQGFLDAQVRVVNNSESLVSSQVSNLLENYKRTLQAYHASMSRSVLFATLLT